MATYKILYWQEIPVQIKADGDGESVKLQVTDNVMNVVDAFAMRQGIIGTDDYLEQWHWSEPAERPGSAQEVAHALQQELVPRLKTFQ